jgi:hypothetical protein
VLVHESYLEEEEVEEPTTITAVGKKKQPTNGGVQTQTDGETETEDDGQVASREVSREVAVFECPQCGDELEGSECDNCGFEFSASDVEDGRITVEGASSEDLVAQLHKQKEGEEGPTIRPHPPMGTIEESSIPELIDRVDRDLKLDWLIHSFELSVRGSLNVSDVEKYGINEDYADVVSVEETFDVEPTKPLRKTDLTNFLMDLDAPEQASVELKLQVEKDAES